MKEKLDINIYQYKRRLCAMWGKLKTNLKETYAYELMCCHDDIELVGKVNLLAKYAADEKNIEILDELEALGLIYINRDVKEKEDTYNTYIYDLTLRVIATISKKCNEIIVHINGFTNSAHGGAL